MRDERAVRFEASFDDHRGIVPEGVQSATARTQLTRRLWSTQQEQADERRNLVGSGDRSERIRTYNYPQGRVTDHRIKLTLHRLDAIMDGELTEMIDALTTFSQAELLQSVGE